MSEHKSRKSKDSSKPSHRKEKEESKEEDVLAWVSKSRELELKRKEEERAKAVKMAKMLEEQDEYEEDEDEEEVAPQDSKYGSKDLAGLKVRHGLNNVLEGGAVVLTLKDNSILQDGELNEADDELENIEIAQQLAREKAYREAKKSFGSNEDKFDNDITDRPNAILAKYDEAIETEGIVLNESGEVDEDSKKRMEEVRRKLQGLRGLEVSLGDLPAVPVSDYLTKEELSLKLNKPKKKKKLRKREKLDYDALEAEAKAAGLERAEKAEKQERSLKVQAKREEESQRESELRFIAYEKAKSKAMDQSIALKVIDSAAAEAENKEKGKSEGKYAGLGGWKSKKGEKKARSEAGRAAGGAEKDFDGTEEADLVEEGDAELQRTLQRARQAALRRNAESASVVGVEAVVSKLAEMRKASKEEGKETIEGLVFTDTGEFCRSLQIEEAEQSASVLPRSAVESGYGDMETDAAAAGGGWTEVTKQVDMEEVEGEQEGKGVMGEAEEGREEEEEEEEEEEPMAEQGVGKGLAAALNLLKGRGELQGAPEWGGRTMDKKKSKLVGVLDSVAQPGHREIHIDRKDEFGREMTPKEAFRFLSYKFHGKGPGKMKQEKRLKQYQEELKMKKMAAGDTPLMSMEKMRETQAQFSAPYIVLSGQIKPGQTSDPRSSFGVEKEKVGSLTPMLGNEKVEFFLGLKRKGGRMGPPPPKKPKAK